MKTTTLHPFHKSLGARMVPFGGYEMPVMYTDISTEHRAVRQAAGLFDLGHMGRVRLKGRDATRLADRVQTADAGSIPQGRTRYALMLFPDGGVRDDILISREHDGYLLVVNASNRAADLEFLHEQARGLEVAIVDDSDRQAMVAIQGPNALAIVSALGFRDAGAVGYYRFATADSAFGPTIVSRTGYTGEDGYELFLDAGQAEPLCRQALELGQRHGLRPCGLGARDTLRLEAGMPLYGHEIDATINPYEANLGSAVRSTADFVGSGALERVRQEGPKRALVGLIVEGPHIPRQGCTVLRDGQAVGAVCSGTLSPTLGVNIATALIGAAAASAGTGYTVAIRKHLAEARPTTMPFYRRPKGLPGGNPSSKES
jgi:aminomethyltransferase